MVYEHIERMNAKIEEAEERMRQKAQIHQGLTAGIIEVSFTKKDGTDRTMKCTLNNQYLPEQKDLKDEIDKRNKSDEVIAVWDIEKEGWRSFRWDSVKGYKV
tara:strand:- start:186 stop:491 length:306 start_codon:yes stop_codon:yes gene_type:complete